MQLTVHTDGGALHNPGPAACAYVVTDPNGHMVEKKYIFLGNQTNNYAEYSGIRAALSALDVIKKTVAFSSLLFISDSLLMVNQLNGVYKIKNDQIRAFVFEIRTLEQGLAVPITYKHVLREYNQEADALVKECLFPYHS